MSQWDPARGALTRRLPQCQGISAAIRRITAQKKIKRRRKRTIMALSGRDFGVSEAFLIRKNSYLSKLHSQPATPQGSLSNAPPPRLPLHARLRNTASPGRSPVPASLTPKSHRRNRPREDTHGNMAGVTRQARHGKRTHRAQLLPGHDEPRPCRKADRQTAYLLWRGCYSCVSGELPGRALITQADSLKRFPSAVKPPSYAD